MAENARDDGARRNLDQRQGQGDRQYPRHVAAGDHGEQHRRNDFDGLHIISFSRSIIRDGAAEHGTVASAYTFNQPAVA